IIRRNRLDLKYYKQKPPIPKIEDPIESFFELTEEQSKFYDEVIKAFDDIEEGGKFQGAIYFPVRYQKEYLFDEEKENLSKEENFIYLFQRNLYDFMRRLLVKRFESSFGAFQESIKRFIEIHENVQKFIEKTNGKFILDRNFINKILELVNDEDDELIFEKLQEYENTLKEGKIDPKFHEIYEINKFKYKNEFLRDIESDKKLFKDILEKFEKLNLSNIDPKAEKLVEEINKIFREKGVEKVVIFTEYIDTAKHLEKYLEKYFKDELLPAYGNLKKSKIEAIYKNFDAQHKEQENKYKILLTTDKISEGFNLNRAGVVINYDIPWNPVRVIQRVGRINRIAKKVYDTIYIINFFPTEKGADIVKSREIAANKMFMIHKVLGEDSKIFSPDEEPQPSALYKKITEYKEDQEESFLSKIKKDFEKIKKNYPEIEKQIQNMPFRIKISKKGEKDEILVFIKKGNDLFIGYKDYQEEKPKVVSFQEVYEKIKVENEKEQALTLSENFWKNYIEIVEQKEFLNNPYFTNNKGENTELKAFYLLKSLLKLINNSEEFKNYEKLKNYKEFISNLIEDVRVYGTLSSYILSEIKKWEKYYHKKQFNKIVENLEKLKEEIGEDFIEKSTKHYENLKETVIIAIENRKNYDN
ncbi:MAG: helicase-related protein, partial [bacterium]